MILSGSFEQILTVAGFLLGIFPMIAVLGLYTRAANEPARVHALIRYFAAPLFISGSLLILVMGAREKPSRWQFPPHASPSSYVTACISPRQPAHNVSAGPCTGPRMRLKADGADCKTVSGNTAQRNDKHPGKRLPRSARHCPGENERQKGQAFRLRIA
jgi:hypothetical protein